MLLLWKFQSKQMSGRMAGHEEQMVSRETLHHDIGPRKNNVTGNKRCPEKLFTMNLRGSLKAYGGWETTQNVESNMCPEKVFTMTSALKNNVTENKRCPEKLFTMDFCGSLRASRGRKATKNMQRKRCPEKLFTMNVTGSLQASRGRTTTKNMRSNKCVQRNSSP